MKVEHRGRVMVEDKVSLAGCRVFPDVVVGYRSYANDTMIRAHTRIGRYCSIGRRCTINAGSHAVNWLTTHPLAYDPDFRAPDVRSPPSRTGRSQTLIGNDVWIGDNALILSGVALGDGCVVGGGSVVTRDVAPYAIVAGVPARVIRRRFGDEQVSRLLALSWWDYGEEILKGLPFDRIEACLGELEARIASGQYGKHDAVFSEWRAGS